jgi:RNA polymerase sigma-70 factor, ECF subfamily
MINPLVTGHRGGVATDPELSLGDPAVAPTASAIDDDASRVRLRAIVEAHHDFVWRSLRRLGVATADVDDGAQRVFLTASRKLAAIRLGSERAFLFQTSLRVAADSRRTRRRRREVADAGDGAEEGPLRDTAIGGEELLDLRRAREDLDRMLDAMPLELRAVFVLFELDELTMVEIADLLDLPPGTVASRLRRARAEFRERATVVRGDRTRGGAA